MCKIQIIFVLLLIVPGLLLAQTKIDEYGKLISDDEHARLYHFANKLKDAPGSKGFIVICKPKYINTGSFLRHLYGVKETLVSNFGVDPERIEVVAGNERDKMWTEHWLIGENEKKPVVVPFDVDGLLKQKISKMKLFDFECLECDKSPFIDQGMFSRGLDHYAAALKANPGSRALLLIGRVEYVSKTQKERSEITRLILDRLVKQNHIDRNRIKIRFFNSEFAGIYIVPGKAKIRN